MNSIYLFLQESKNMFYTQEGKHSVDLSSLYDPCFLLPLFSFILRPGNLTRHAHNAFFCFALCIELGLSLNLYIYFILQKHLPASLLLEGHMLYLLLLTYAVICLSLFRVCGRLSEVCFQSCFGRHSGGPEQL